MKITVFSGAGISKESGINTFRNKAGIWEKYNYDEVSSISGGGRKTEKML
mgnify:CR=1 FL=1